MTAPRVANGKARAYVQRREEFEGSNTYGTWRRIYHDDHRVQEHPEPMDELYVVYSYGHHWPLFVHSAAANKWFANTGKYSKTTSKHHGQLHPFAPTIGMDTDDLKFLINWGWPEFVAKRLIGTELPTLEAA